jgi:serine/threonine protein kinase
MRNVQTGDLNSLLVLQYASDIASGMAYLHSKDIIHGDLKV